jgi:hypothetical protein
LLEDQSAFALDRLRRLCASACGPAWIAGASKIQAIEHPNQERYDTRLYGKYNLSGLGGQALDRRAVPVDKRQAVAHFGAGEFPQAACPGTQTVKQATKAYVIGGQVRVSLPGIVIGVAFICSKSSLCHSAIIFLT